MTKETISITPIKANVDDYFKMISNRMIACVYKAKALDKKYQFCDKITITDESNVFDALSKNIRNIHLPEGYNVVVNSTTGPCLIGQFGATYKISLSVKKQ